MACFCSSNLMAKKKLLCGNLQKRPVLLDDCTTKTIRTGLLGPLPVNREPDILSRSRSLVDSDLKIRQVGLQNQCLQTALGAKELDFVLVVRDLANHENKSEKVERPAVILQTPTGCLNSKAGVRMTSMS